MQTLISVQAKMPIESVLNSDYRTPRHNNMLECAVVNSMHIQGRVADIAVTKFPVSALAKISEEAGAHGIEKYPDFLHMDTGPRGRRW